MMLTLRRRCLNVPTTIVFLTLTKLNDAFKNLMAHSTCPICGTTPWSHGPVSLTCSIVTGSIVSPSTPLRAPPPPTPTRSLNPWSFCLSTTAVEAGLSLALLSLEEDRGGSSLRRRKHTARKTRSLMMSSTRSEAVCQQMWISCDFVNIDKFLNRLN